MDALLAAGLESRGDRAPGPGPVRVVLVPTAAARQRPDLAAAHGAEAWHAAARRSRVAVTVETARILHRADADDRTTLALLEAADVVHLPGGDPDVIPAVLRDTRAWAAIVAASRRGACIAGASAGAMALGERLWTADGPMDGLRLLAGMAVVPHLEPSRARAWRAAVDPRDELAWLGLGERTLAIGRAGGPWRIAGPGEACWIGRAAGDLVR
jgi:cyanophycinase-like exopeptidase